MQAPGGEHEQASGFLSSGACLPFAASPERGLQACRWHKRRGSSQSGHPATPLMRGLQWHAVRVLWDSPGRRVQLSEAVSCGQARIEDFIVQCQSHAMPCSAFHFGSGYSSIDGKRYTFNWNRCARTTAPCF
jgi:hypothetical protein